MLSFLPGPVKGALVFFLILLNTIVNCSILFTIAIIKFVVPIEGFRKFCSAVLIVISSNWISINNFFMRLALKTKWVVTGADDLAMNDWYMVLSNHQTWTDIPVLQRVFNRRIPFLKFFLKKELIWVPLLGLTWWALDYPFMKRYSKEFLEKNPHLKGKDLEATKIACEKFKKLPVSVMNFVEGTRFTKSKHAKQQSPFKHLLKPKAAGIAFVLASMGGQIRCILDVTIAYPGGQKGIWDFMCGRVAEVRVDVTRIPMSDEIVGDYFNDAEFRERFQEWLNKVWAEKDARLGAMLARS